jgi:hypothetical protein
MIKKFKALIGDAVFELLGCPFCGKRPDVMQWQSLDVDIRCGNNRCKSTAWTSTSGKYRRKEASAYVIMAVKRWNQRA